MCRPTDGPRRLPAARRLCRVAAAAAAGCVLLVAGGDAAAAGVLLPPADAARALAEVDSLLAAGRSAAAVEAALEAARRWAGDPLYGWQVEGRAGAALLAAGRPVEALPRLEAAIGLQPLDGALRHHLGLALAALGRRGRALAEFEESARLDPAAVAPRLEAGRVRGQLGDIAGAAREWAAALRLCGGCPEPDRLLAGLLLGADRPAEAVAPLRRLHAAAGGDPEIRRNLVAALALAGQDSALLDLVGEIAQDGWTADEWRQAVQAEGRLGSARVARAALERLGAPAAGDALPREDDVFWARAAANLLADAQPEASLAAIDRALFLRPGHRVYHHNRAAALAALGRHEEARRALAAAGSDPEDRAKENR